jgi:hypothetical protein
MKINLNYDGLRSLNTPAEQRTALFNSLKAALLFRRDGRREGRRPAAGADVRAGRHHAHR